MRHADAETAGSCSIALRSVGRSLAAFMDDGIAPDNAFRVQLGADGRLIWSAEEDGKPIHYDVEPMSTTGQRMQAGLIRLLPVEKQL